MKHHQLTNEIELFNDIWEGGYYEGDPLTPLSRSSFHQLGYMSVLHATYLRCIKPYITTDTVALEIGPGRGAWTKAMLASKEVWAIDAKSEKDNCFFEYLNHPKHVTYLQVKDFKCEMLPENKFNYMFSFGCLCHVPFEGIAEYAANIYPKMKQGSHCFWMIADTEKHNHVIQNIDTYSIWNALAPKSKMLSPLRFLFKLLMKAEMRREKNQHSITTVKEHSPKPGSWYHAGTERTCSMLKEVGYHIVDPDVDTILRDPIIHFRKL